MGHYSRVIHGEGASFPLSPPSISQFFFRLPAKKCKNMIKGSIHGPPPKKNLPRIWSAGECASVSLVSLKAAKDDYKGRTSSFLEIVSKVFSQGLIANRDIQR